MPGNICSSISLMALLGAMPFAGIAADCPITGTFGPLAQVVQPPPSSGMTVNPLSPLGPIEPPVSGSTSSAGASPAGAMGPVGTTPPNDVAAPNAAVYPGSTAAPENAINPGGTIEPGGIISPGSVIDTTGAGGASSTGQ